MVEQFTDFALIGSLTLLDRLHEHLAPPGDPVLGELPLGHGEEAKAVPLGPPTILDCARRELIRRIHGRLKVRCGTYSARMLSCSSFRQAPAVSSCLVTTRTAEASMDQMYLMGVASRRAEWLSNRQTVIAENVANANTPGYTSKDIKPFSDVMETTRLEMSGSSPLHLVSAGGRSVDVEETGEDAWDVLHSGNSVTLEQEMLKAGEVSRDFALNTSIVKAFHSMFMSTVKG
ncbi:flagellar basal body rod protein FlgB [Consotaella aegiceratis]|uniref:flagellar basal body rod protein FlgB n=1 Tax=Consotaella aegiceratis TaxID=3097961 RepID=UPI002F409DD1